MGWVSTWTVSKNISIKKKFIYNYAHNIKPPTQLFLLFCLGPCRKCFKWFMWYSSLSFLFKLLFLFRLQVLRNLTKSRLEGWSVHLWLCLGFDSWHSHNSLLNKILALICFSLICFLTFLFFADDCINLIVWITIIFFIDFTVLVVYFDTFSFFM